jgi:hypothetical protein
VEAVAQPAPTPTGNRRRITGLLLALITVAVLAAGGWGVASVLTAESPPARLGEAVGVPGGLLLVEKVTPENMAAMQIGNFAEAGMSGMSSPMGMDMAPEGQRRFAVNVTLAAERGDLSYSPEDFRISGEGVKNEAGPIRHQFDAGTVPAGGAISGSLVFQVPEEAKGLMLSFGDGGQKVALDLKPATESDGHSHGGAQSQQGDGHSDGHDH